MNDSTLSVHTFLVPDVTLTKASRVTSDRLLKSFTRGSVLNKVTPRGTDIKTWDWVGFRGDEDHRYDLEIEEGKPDSTGVGPEVGVLQNTGVGGGGTRGVNEFLCGPHSVLVGQVPTRGDPEVEVLHGSQIGGRKRVKGSGRRPSPVVRSEDGPSSPRSRTDGRHVVPRVERVNSFFVPVRLLYEGLPWPTKSF